MTILLSLLVLWKMIKRIYFRFGRTRTKAANQQTERNPTTLNISHPHRTFMSARRILTALLETAIRGIGNIKTYNMESRRKDNHRKCCSNEQIERLKDQSGKKEIKRIWGKSGTYYVQKKKYKCDLFCVLMPFPVYFPAFSLNEMNFQFIYSIDF